uniref:Uncharacterized protein n=1 Tax=Rhizophora mucronata TaxID=61149 RepID=A0A2P2PC70_RHIMU
MAHGFDFPHIGAV